MANSSAALTTEDLHLEDDDGVTEDTDNDSFLENSSLRNMMKDSIQLLDSLTNEMKKEFSQESNNRTTTNANAKFFCPSHDSPKPRIVTPTAATTAESSNKLNEVSLKDMTISVTIEDSHTGNKFLNSGKPTATTPMSNVSMFSASSPLASPLASPVFATTTVKSITGAIKIPTLDDLPTSKGPTNGNYEDDFSLDDSLANEMNALKQVAFELEQELQSANTHSVQAAIERIGNSQDPKVKGVLESEDMEVIRKILDDEIHKNESSQNRILNYLYKTVMKIWNHGEATHLFVIMAGIVWSIVFALLYKAMTMELQ